MHVQEMLPLSLVMAKNGVGAIRKLADEGNAATEVANRPCSLPMSPMPWRMNRRTSFCLEQNMNPPISDDGPPAQRSFRMTQRKPMPGNRAAHHLVLVAGAWVGCLLAFVGGGLIAFWIFGEIFNNPPVLAYLGFPLAAGAGVAAGFGFLASFAFRGFRLCLAVSYVIPFTFAMLLLSDSPIRDLAAGAAYCLALFGLFVGFGWLGLRVSQNRNKEGHL